MKKNKRNSKIIQGTYGRIREVKDFLPRPEELTLRNPETVKVTMSLEKRSIDFFKTEARRLGSSYQRMIRNLLTEYVNRTESKQLKTNV